MRKNYYAKELTIFGSGFIAGMCEAIIISLLKKFGYEVPAWMFYAATASVLATLCLTSRYLRDLDEIDTEELAEQLEQQAHQNAAIELMARDEAKEINTPQACDNEALAAGLTFSYPTKALEAAHAASLKFWRDFDPERPPLQKQITAFMIERGVPARQAAELAIAIKPDGLPSA
jgi:hypothetical protein